jgi:uncharacterized protein (TIGR00730 family)
VSRPVVTVFGASAPREGEQAYDVARAVGRRLGELGFALANGGYAGTMEASARGAKEAGSTTIGVTCSIWRSDPNAYIDEVIRTEVLGERLATLIELGTAGYVVLPGATGTLLELAAVWEQQLKHILPRRPIVCMGDFWRPLVEMMASARADSRSLVDLLEAPSDLDRCFTPAGAS